MRSGAGGRAAGAHGAGEFRAQDLMQHPAGRPACGELPDAGGIAPDRPVDSARQAAIRCGTGTLLHSPAGLAAAAAAVAGWSAAHCAQCSSA
ncbi:hypothetical protein CR165_20175 [Pseudoroseomonas aestuarii]|uniref:Uncharacterized protein n=1 Tax=Teichococcus aestuarii TaxID=568898 RepID=A0A2U1UZC9_9PROT|nr:hypothetical protein CR165_20175 [Pseudoroseomonas aestuarii]